MKFTIDGKAISFAQFLQEMGGSGVIYEDDIEEMLLKWEPVDWEYALDYLAPIAAEIVVEAAETNVEVYNNIMRVLVESYLILKRDLGLKPHIRRIK